VDRVPNETRCKKKERAPAALPARTHSDAWAGEVGAIEAREAEVISQVGMGKVKSKTVETMNVDQPVLHPSEVKYDLQKIFFRRVQCPLVEETF
jgi:predicted PolB exonuclease-like 3'-5' exonuclease